MSELRLPKLNVVVLAGRLTKDCELRYTQSGKQVANFTLAFDRSYKKNNEWVQESSFIDVITWGDLSERVATNAHKGSPVIVEGYIQTRSWQDKNNNSRKTTEIVAHKVNMLEKSEQMNGNSEQADDSNAPF